MQQLNRLLLRQAQKYLGGAENIPENYMAFITAISEAYDHYEKDRHMLERSIELSSEEMIQLNSKLTRETEELKKAHNDLKNTEHVRLEKRLDEEKIKNLQEITEAVKLRKENVLFLPANYMRILTRYWLLQGFILIRPFTMSICA